jgi:hypothetical protein
MKHIILCLFILIISSTLVLGSDFTPQGNINLRNKYGIYNTSFICFGVDCITDWSGISGITVTSWGINKTTMLNQSGNLSINITYLNTLYTGKSYETLYAELVDTENNNNETQRLLIEDIQGDYVSKTNNNNIYGVNNFYGVVNFLNTTSYIETKSSVVNDTIVLVNIENITRIVLNASNNIKVWVNGTSNFTGVVMVTNLYDNDNTNYFDGFCPYGTYSISTTGALSCANNSDTRWNLTGSKYLINTTNILEFNESQINLTIIALTPTTSSGGWVNDSVKTNTSLNASVNAQKIEVNSPGHSEIISNAASGSTAIFRMNTGGTQQWHFEAQDAYYRIVESGVGYPFIILKTSHNVGIKTLSPGYQVEVNGSIWGNNISTRNFYGYLNASYVNNSYWLPTTSTICNLTDVNCASVADGKCLKYDSGTGKNIYGDCGTGTGSSSYANDTYYLIPIIDAPQTAQTWTSQPTAETQLFNNDFNRRRANLVNAIQYRLQTHIATAGSNASRIYLQFNNSGTWTNCSPSGNNIRLNVTGFIVSNWTDMVTACKSDVLLRIMAISGNGTASPSLRSLHIEVRALSVNTTIPVSSSGATSIGAGYLYNITNTMYLNETLLNNTIDAREVTGGTNKGTSGSYLFNDTDYYYFNETRMNSTILSLSSRFNETSTILIINTSLFGNVTKINTNLSSIEGNITKINNNLTSVWGNLTYINSTLFTQINTNITNHQTNYKHGNTTTEILSVTNGKVNSTSWNNTGLKILSNNNLIVESKKINVTESLDVNITRYGASCIRFNSTALILESTCLV